MQKTVPKAVAMALKALSQGKASEGQQKLSLDYILFDLARLREPSFEAGEKPLQSAHNEGRRFVGLMIAGAIEAKPAAMTRSKPSRTREAKSDD